MPILWHNVPRKNNQIAGKSLPTESLLTVDELAYERDDCNVFNPINLVVEAGDILQIEGANGAGKTTLMRLLTSALQQTSGSIAYQGQSIAQCRYEYLADILYIGHQSGTKMGLSPAENLCWMSPASTSKAEITHALENLGLAGYTDVPCYSLSAGQHRRVALARLATSQAKIWYLDEPFTAIDKEGVKAIEKQLQNHAEQGGAVVLSTHQDLALDTVRKYSIEAHTDRGGLQ